MIKILSLKLQLLLYQPNKYKVDFVSKSGFG